MKKKDIWSYITVGSCLRFLQDARKGWPIHKEFSVLWNVDKFLIYLEDLDLAVTERASGKLRTFSETLREMEEESVLTQALATELSGIITEVRPTFSAEARGIYSFIITDKRFHVDRLLGGVEKLFAPDVFEILPDICKYDFMEAGKCIAFNRATAAAFHLMRGVESLLNNYYKKYIRPAKKGLTWGQMTHALNNKNRGKKPNETTMNQLNHLRVAFRNPTQHPEKRYDIEESQDLLFLCIDIINRMNSEINS